MWSEATIIVLLLIFATARTTDEINEKHNDHDYVNSYDENSWEFCSNSTGYPIEKVYEKINQKTSFCDEEDAKTWITCFYKKEGAMDENYVINDIVFIEESSYDEEKLGIIKECINQANTEDDFERACTLDDCLELNNLIDELVDEYEYEGEHFHDHDYEHPHNHVHDHFHHHHRHDIHSSGEEDELDLEGDDIDDADNYDDKNGRQPLSDDNRNDKNEEGEPHE